MLNLAQMSNRSRSARFWQYLVISIPVFTLCFIYFFLFSLLVVLLTFFSSLTNLRCTFFTSSNAGKFSGCTPLCLSILRTAVLLSTCSLLICCCPFMFPHLCFLLVRLYC